MHYLFITTPSLSTSVLPNFVAGLCYLLRPFYRPLGHQHIFNLSTVTSLRLQLAILSSQNIFLPTSTICTFPRLHRVSFLDQPLWAYSFCLSDISLETNTFLAHLLSQLRHWIHSNSSSVTTFNSMSPLEPFRWCVLLHPHTDHPLSFASVTLAILPALPDVLFIVQLSSKTS